MPEAVAAQLITQGIVPASGLAEALQANCRRRAD